MLRIISRDIRYSEDTGLTCGAFDESAIDAEIVLEDEQALLGLAAQGGIGEIVHEVLVGIDGADGRRLIQTRVGHTLKQRLPNIEGSLLSIVTLGIAREILAEGGTGSLVVPVAVLGHTQHVQALLGVGTALLHRYQFGK